MKITKKISVLFLTSIMLLGMFSLFSCNDNKNGQNASEEELTAFFYADDELVGTVKFDKNDTSLRSMPRVPKKAGKVGAWESHKLDGKDIRINAIYADSFTVKIVAADPSAVTFDGETEQIISPTNISFRQVKINVSEGFVIDYYIIDGVKYNSTTIRWNNVNADTEIIVYTKSVLDEIPTIHINTDGAPISNKTEYVPMKLDMTNSDSDLSNIAGGIRLRGNSTLGYPKKAYRIKFDKKQSLFGLPKAKSWVLLAELLDPSNLHNHAAMTLASEMPGITFTPTPHKVNVFLNGGYIGMYTLCEQVEEDEGRMDIEMKEITPSMKELSDYNWFISLDYNAQFDSSLVLDESYFAIEGHGNIYFDTLYFELKYPEKDMFPSEKQFESFMSQLKDYIHKLLDDFDNQDTKKLNSKVNMNSLIDYVIIDEIMGQEDHDAWHKSFNIYYTSTSKNKEENGKVSFGPIWDYDWCLHTPWTDSPNEFYEVTDKIEYFGPFYTVVFENEDYLDVLKSRYKKYALPALQKYIDGYDSLVDSIETSTEKNADLWYSGYDPEITEKNIAFFKEFLIFRRDVLNDAWT